MGETIKTNLAEFIPVGFHTCLVPEILFPSDPRAGMERQLQRRWGQGRVQKWLPPVGLVLSGSLFLHASGTRDEEAEGLSAPSQATWGYPRRAVPLSIPPMEFSHPLADSRGAEQVRLASAPRG